MQPALQMSLAVEYCRPPRRISGALEGQPQRGGRAERVALARNATCTATVVPGTADTTQPKGCN